MTVLRREIAGFDERSIQRMKSGARGRRRIRAGPAGAMWGDAQNWWMRSVSDNTFEMKSDFFSVRMEFQLGPDGQAQAMQHDLDFMPSPLQKMGPLPEGWGECLQRRG